MTARYPTTCLVLLVEDEGIVAIDLNDELVAAGYTVAGPFSSCSDALAWLKTGIPDLAVLDIMLRDGPCRELAAELTRREVPFVVYSVSDQRKNRAYEFMSAPWIEKPASSEMVLAALADLQRDQMRREG